MDLTIRPATPADIPPLIPLFAEHAAFEAASFCADAQFQERLAAAAFGAQPRLLLWLAVTSEDLFGYAAAYREFSTWSASEYLHLDCLYVREARRGGGVGGQLISAVIERVRQMGLAEMQWQTPAWNSRAIEFYRRLGAKALEKQRFYLPV
ncbi:GNAT family N-acetyltransferase [Microbulbifer halophilus]|uniref:GNAT family N-acetyltransferase n=1 Tax=Microbulbifer halophilus TaxID=453963 RepID=A0ABW5E7A2_9GAMM|nr:GNAT family N-acetyltransferase [Microbulbifer halophilus]MCW8125842.1 GNAT family N-acetyltransferase [Microbulbifer halophilus]